MSGVLADSDVVIETLTTYDGYTAGVDFQTHKLKVDAPLETINKGLFIRPLQGTLGTRVHASISTLKRQTVSCC